MAVNEKYELLKKLCMANGVSGDEDDVRDLIKSEIESYFDEITVDNLGSLIAFKKGKKTPPKKILYLAHMDETGYYVKKIDDDGFLRLDSIGVPANVTPGKTVTVKATGSGEPKLIKGVIGNAAIHLSHGSQNVPAIKELGVDIGAKKKDEAEGKVALGDSVYFDSEFDEFGNFLKAKAFDDRVGCFNLINMIKSDLEYDTWFAFVVQEEVGTRGSKAVGYRLNPDIAFILEGTTAADIGGVDPEGKVCLLGKGVALSFADRSSIYNPVMVERAAAAANAENVLWQPKTFVSGGNDAGSVQRSADGTLVCTLSVPVRYLHSRISVCAPADIDSMYDFCMALQKHMDTIFSI